MFSKDDDGQHALVLALVFGLVAMVIALVIGLAIRAINTSSSSGTGRSGFAQSTPTATMLAVPGSAVGASVAAEPQPADSKVADAEAAQTAADAASIKVESGVVKFYFASGKAELEPASVAVLADLIAAAQAGRKLVISGFHDGIGNPARNAELALQRAQAVSELLKGSGVSTQQIELSKPQQAQRQDSDAEARRVEVRLY